MMKNQFSTVAMSKDRAAFTLIELLVSIVVLVLMILVVAQAVDTAATIVRPANKHIDTDTQARVVLDHMAVDIGRMLKRTDVDYWVKGTVTYKTHGHSNGHGNGQKIINGQQGNDQIAFYSQVPGIYTQTTNQGPVSLIAYRINEDPNESINSDNPAYLRLERMGKGLLWNGVSGKTNIPVVFLPMTISNTWPAATDPSITDSPSTYETIGPGVFRFEYYYLLKSGLLTGAPFDTTVRTTQTDLTHPVSIGLTDVEAIGVAIAVIDPGSRPLLYDPNPTANAQGGPWHLLYSIVSDMADFADAKGKGNPAKNIGDVENQWNSVVQSVATNGRTSDGSTVPPAAAKAIRIYNRYFDLKTL
jgi:hypothetical protein